MLQRILALMIKEFLAVLKDKKTRMVVFVPPVVQTLIFGYAATYDLTHVAYAVYNEDPGPAARELLARFAGSPNFGKGALITREDEIAALVESKKALLVLHVGPNFSSHLLAGDPADLQVIVDGRDSNTAMVALNYVRAIVDAFNERWAEDRGRPGPLARLVFRSWFNPNLESRWFIVTGIVGLLTLVVTTLLTALSVAREREHGTFDQLLVTPLRPADILIGKALPGFLIGMTEATVIVMVVVFWFKVPLLGSLLTLYTGLVLFLLSTVGVGLMISSLAVTQQQGLLGAFLFLVPAVILSGFSTPIANMPPLVQDLTLLNPLRYFMVVLRGVFLEGTPFHLLIDQFWPMATIGVVALTLAGWLFRRRMY